MRRMKPGVHKSGALFASLRARTYVMILSAFVLGGCSSFGSPEDAVVASAPPADAQEGRYMSACTQKAPPPGQTKAMHEKKCKCLFDAARKRLNEAEMEMLIANSGRDKRKQAEVRSRHDYNDASFHAGMKSLIGESIACSMGNKT